jgi:FtsP/CotA-like multicopper oxidase with cupredoxin domain
MNVIVERAMKRRDLLKNGSLALAAAAGRGLLPASGSGQMSTSTASPQSTGPADITLRIEPVVVELAPDRILSTIGYNGSSPGPVLRMKEGRPVTVDVVNRTDTPEFVHWHGFLIPAEQDGVEEQGTPAVPPWGQRRFQFTPSPSGSRWYHSHAMAFADLHKGTRGGRSGPLRPGTLPGAAGLGTLFLLHDGG